MMMDWRDTVIGEAEQRQFGAQGIYDVSEMLKEQAKRTWEAAQQHAAPAPSASSEALEALREAALGAWGHLVKDVVLLPVEDDDEDESRYAATCTAIDRLYAAALATAPGASDVGAGEV